QEAERWQQEEKWSEALSAVRRARSSQRLRVRRRFATTDCAAGQGCGKGAATGRDTAPDNGDHKGKWALQCGRVQRRLWRGFSVVRCGRGTSGTSRGEGAYSCAIHPQAPGGRAGLLGIPETADNKRPTQAPSGGRSGG